MNDYLPDIRDACAAMADAHARRNDAMRAARAAGATWRAIAIAADMTEHGVRHALTVSRDPLGRPTAGYVET